MPCAPTLIPSICDCVQDWQALEKAGKPSCFHKDGGKCPSFVTPLYLTKADTQWTCHDTAKYFCTVQCRPGSEKVSWVAHPCGNTDKPCNAAGLKAEELGVTKRELPDELRDKGLDEIEAEAKEAKKRGMWAGPGCKVKSSVGFCWLLVLVCTPSMFEPSSLPPCRK
jgi:hypothetical protein